MKNRPKTKKQKCIDWIFYTLLALLSLFSQSTFAQQTAGKFTVEMDYLLYLPQDYNKDANQNWPLILFLHGAGEQGNDLEKIKKHGPPMLIEKGKQFPFIIVSPQATRGWNADFLMQMLQEIIQKHKVDKDRIYLTGLSMGGYGTWKMGAKFPNFFAAIVPICGGGNPTEIWKLRHMPVWCFHGDADHIVPLSQSEMMVTPLKEINQQVKFTIFPNTGHESWIEAYNDPKLYEWLLSHKRYKHKAISVDEGQLKKLEGHYLMGSGSKKDTITVKIKDGALTISAHNRTTPLKPLAPDQFFIHENSPVEFHFKNDKSGKIESILVYENKLMTLPRINH
ncbi:hypothetical protein EMN47_13715 [Prolixibacteraceae bacterium JC049]|nr:hypothetical protein [Prolixibacteraceae bacterium JC049]